MFTLCSHSSNDRRVLQRDKEANVGVETVILKLSSARSRLAMTHTRDNKSAFSSASNQRRRSALSKSFPEIPGQSISRQKGRGSPSNRSGRFENLQRERIDDGWDNLEQKEVLKTEIQTERAKSIITRNNSPDISFDRSINPYRGCEHGCIYCYARPTHSYLGLSPGLDFETRLFAKTNAPELLWKELAKPGYVPKPIALGTNTDPYQPLEKDFEITRQILEILEATRHPVTIVTKSQMITRDLPLLTRMANRNLVKVAISVTSLDHRFARKLEPRATTPKKRLEALRQLSDAGIPTAVMVAPIIPALNTHEIEAILQAAKAAGVQEAGYVILRLPLEVRDLFVEWLRAEFPSVTNRVLAQVLDIREGKAYRGERMRGRGAFADSIADRFELTRKKLQLGIRELRLNTDDFKAPSVPGAQLNLF